jgi:integrase/recombinase XerD
MALFGDIITSKQTIDNLSFSTELGKLARQHLEWLMSKGYSKFTVMSRAYILGDFISWADLRDITRAREVTKQVLERYRRYVYHCRKPDGQPLDVKTQALRLITLRVFFRWLARNDFIHYNPASDLELPKIGRSLPRHVLNLKEIETVINQVDLTTPLGIRNRAILETLFCTGIRRQELANLKINDIDFERGTLMIRQGKGKRDRIVPIGERAMAWLEKYIQDVRPSLLKYTSNDNEDTAAKDENGLFIGRYGDPIKTRHLTNLVEKYIKKANISKSGGCHMFRHSMATLMLEGGADIRYIQEMLGHESLQSTQIYTRVSIDKLKEVHKKTHPGANFKRRSKRK